MRKPVVMVAVGTIVLAGCAEGPAAPVVVQPGSLASSFLESEVPTRSGAEGGDWTRLSDSDLWAHVARADSTVHIGIKAPGAVRGVYRHRLLVGAEDWKAGRQEITAMAGTRLMLTDSSFAMIRLKVDGAAALAAIRQSPYMEYVEPAYMVADEGLSILMSGCSEETWTGDYPYGRGYYSGGDTMSLYFTADFMAVNNAWLRSTGTGVTIGIVDTGVDPNQTQLTSGFSGGSSGGRWYKYLRWDGSTSTTDWADQCGHGTRMAGVATAPNDGKNVIGVAWGANVVVVRHDDDVLLGSSNATMSEWDAYEAGQAIDRAGENYARIVAMAWGTFYSYSYISDKIDSWHYHPDAGRQILFVGAAGTSPCDPLYDAYKDDVIFPARKSEVVAVTGVNYHGHLACEAHYGPEVELAAHVYQPTTGPVSEGSGKDIVNFAGSSTATATISGISALIWSRYPGMARDDVRKRLHESSSYYPNNNGTIGYGVINAHRALGGMWYAAISNCANKTDCTLKYKLAQCETKTFSVSHQGGDGPYSYSWSTGDTGTSASLELCPTAGSVEYYSISVTTKDSSDGTSLYRGATIEVYHSDPDGACSTCAV